MAITTDLLFACERILGPVSVVRDRSWPDGESQVTELADSQGRPWIAKEIRDRHSYERELNAFQCWVPALAGSAPALHASDDALRLLIMTRLPGRLTEETAAETDPGVHEQAGTLLRRLHDAELPVVDHDIAAATARKLENWVSRGRHLLSDVEIAISRELVGPLATVGPIPTVPCHMDNQPRNWVVDESGSVSLIDFGHSRRDVRIHDMSRLYVQQWAGRPDLRDAYYRGYGRAPSSADLALLQRYLAYGALSTVVWAHEHGDPGFEEQVRRTLRQLQSGEASVI